MTNALARMAKRQREARVKAQERWEAQNPAKTWVIVHDYERRRRAIPLDGFRPSMGRVLGQTQARTEGSALAQYDQGIGRYHRTGSSGFGALL